MKKGMLLIGICCLALIVSSCSSETQEGDVQSLPDLVVESSRDSEKEPESAVNTSDESVASSDTEKKESALSQNQQDTLSTDSNTGSSDSSRKTSSSPQREPSKPEPQAPEIPAKQPEKPAEPEEPNPKPEPPQESEPAPPEKLFDINTYVEFARNYVTETLNLTLDPTAKSCWDDPISASKNSKYLERDLKDRLDWYKVSGFTSFWIWSENLGGGNYNIYIGYA